MATTKTHKTLPKYYCYLKSHNSCLILKLCLVVEHTFMVNLFNLLVCSIVITIVVGPAAGMELYLQYITFCSVSILETIVVGPAAGMELYLQYITFCSLSILEIIVFIFESILILLCSEILYL